MKLRSYVIFLVISILAMLAISLKSKLFLAVLFLIFACTLFSEVFSSNKKPSRK